MQTADGVGKTENKWTPSKIATIWSFLFLFIRCGQSFKEKKATSLISDQFFFSFSYSANIHSLNK